MQRIPVNQVSTPLAQMLEGFDCPAILVAPDYEILATNQRYQDQFEDQTAVGHRCYQVSHGYKVPCDQAGEDCPLGAALASKHRERVLHIHQSPRGPEHVDVELIPITEADGTPQFFIELMRTLPLKRGSGSADRSLIGATAPFNAMLSKVARVSRTDASVLLLGESGTGKELVASAIHQGSARKDHALVTLECAGLTDTLFESELFGHVRGAFTGASSTRKGLVAAADGGTLFLDEIGDVPLPMQVKLLRLLETGTYRAVGSTQLMQADFRLICATHKDLPALIERGEFRRDLYYRINVFPIRLPPLRERMDDLPELARTLLQRLSPGKEYHLTQRASQSLASHPFPGNIRELRNLLNRAIILADTNMIEADHIREALAVDSEVNPPSSQLPSLPARSPLKANDWVDLKTAEQRYLTALMAAHAEDKEQVAKIAGISVRSLYRKLQLPAHPEAGNEEP